MGVPYPVACTTSRATSGSLLGTVCGSAGTVVPFAGKWQASARKTPSVALRRDITGHSVGRYALDGKSALRVTPSQAWKSLARARSWVVATS